MEVHHHPDLHHKEKKFKEYFLEFLMIFLAVTLGFFAENIREHISDKRLEKEYITGLISNIQNDTTQLNSLIKDTTLQQGIDSLLQVDKSRYLNLAVQDSMFYYSTKYLSDEHDFDQNDITIVQLRNAGGYRLIKKEVADSIAVYESKNTDLKSQAAFYLEAFKLRYQLFNQTFDWAAAKKFIKAYRAGLKIPADVRVLTTSDQQKIDLYFNQCFSLAFVRQGYMLMLKEHLTYLNRFMAFLQKEYNLK